MSIKHKIAEYIDFYAGARIENERHQWVIQQLKALPESSKILDAGAGEMRYKPYCKHLSYTAQDFGEYNGTDDGHGFHKKWDTSGIDVKCDICDMPFQENEFDAVLCTEVLEHVPQAEQAVAELIRVLKPGGVLIITAPFTSYTHFSTYHFCTGFNKYWYEYIFEKYDVEIKKDDWYGNYFSMLRVDMWRVMEMSEKYCGHRPGIFFMILTTLYCRYLRKIERNDSGSSEYNRMGDRVLGIKNTQV